jgi:surface protein
MMINTRINTRLNTRMNLVHPGSLLKQDPAFKITVDTTKAGSASDTFVLPLDGSSTYDFQVDWGDGTFESVTTNTDVTHTYAAPGEYQISISGTFPHIYFNDGGDKLKLISIDNWGSIKWQSMYRAFWGCSNMDGTYTDTPNFSNMTNMGSMFSGCSSFNQPVSNFDTSNVTHMSSVFYGCSSFNQPVSNFDTSNVTNMSYMFYGCSSFNQPVSNFDTSNVAIMRAMFYNCSSFNQDLSLFSIESVTNLVDMLKGCDINETGTTTNYDNLLVSFENQAGLYGKTGLDFHGGNSEYSATGEAARDSLTAATPGGYGWTITDDGLAT